MLPKSVQFTHTVRTQDFYSLQGSWTPIHADVLRSYSWSTNVTGRKRWRMLPPELTPLLFDRFGREMAPRFDADGEEDGFPNLALAARHVVELEQVRAARMRLRGLIKQSSVTTASRF